MLNCFDCTVVLSYDLVCCMYSYSEVAEVLYGKNKNMNEVGMTGKTGRLGGRDLVSREQVGRRERRVRSVDGDRQILDVSLPG